MHHYKKRDCCLKKLINKFTFTVKLLCVFLWAPTSVFALEPPVVPEFVLDFLQESDLQVGGFYQNSFEKIEDFKGHYIVPPKHKNSSSHNLGNNNVQDGQFSHKAWMYRTNRYVEGENTNHRAYPTFQMNRTSLGVVKTMVLVDLYVWLDVELVERPEKNWFSLATYTSYLDPKWFRTYLVNLDSDYRMHLMHVPEQGVSQPDIFQSKALVMPKKRWVRMTTLIDFGAKNRFGSPIIAVWQDGELASASRFNDRVNPYRLNPSSYPKCLQDWDKQDVEGAEGLCGLNYLGGLAQMHFGLYAPSGLSKGVIYNDNLVVSELVRKK